MKLSIVIPVYNVEKYIERCLNSIFNLNLENEIILIDDGSTDRSLEIIEKIKENNINENIKIIRQSNQGPSEARNKGIEIAEGEYISFIDSDDFVDKDKYRELIVNTMKNGLDLGIGNMQKYYFKEEKNAVFFRDDSIKKLGIRTGQEYFVNMVKADSYYCAVYNSVYKKEFLLLNNIFFKTGMLCEDLLFTYLCYCHAAKVEYYDILFYNYNQENISSIMTVTDVKKYIDAIKFYDIILDYVSDGNFSEEFYNATTSLISKSFDWTITDTLNTSKSENMEKVFLEFRDVFKKHRKIIKNNTSKRIYKNYKLINFNYKLYIFIYMLKNKWRKIRRKR